MARHTNIYGLLTDLEEGRDYQPQSQFTGGAPSSLIDSHPPADATLIPRSHEHSCDKSVSDSSNVSADQSTAKAPLQASDQFRKRPRRRPSKKHKFELLERPDAARTQLPLEHGSLPPVPHRPPLDNTQGLYALTPQFDGTKLEIGPQNMATSANASFGDARRNLTSPRPRGRENTKNIPCRNITIYGNCRYENDGCLFNHDRNVFAATAPAPANAATNTAANTAPSTATSST